MALTFKSPSLVTQEVIDQAAAALGVKFPVDYADFMLKTNGGVPKPSTLKVDAGDYKIDRLYSISATVPQKHSAIVSELVPMNLSLREDGELGLPTEFLAIGLVDEQDILVLTVKGEGIGAVSSWPTEASVFLPRQTTLTSSFSEFLKSLEQPSAGAKARAELRKKFDRLENLISNRKWSKVKQLAAELDIASWEPDSMHPVISAIGERDLESVQQLHVLGFRFDVQDFFGNSARRVAERKSASDAECLAGLKPGTDSATMDKWQKYSVNSQAVLAFFIDQNIV